MTVASSCIAAPIGSPPTRGAELRTDAPMVDDRIKLAEERTMVVVVSPRHASEWRRSVEVLVRSFDWPDGGRSWDVFQRDENGWDLLWDEALDFDPAPEDIVPLLGDGLVLVGGGDDDQPDGGE